MVAGDPIAPSQLSVATVRPLTFDSETVSVGPAGSGGVVSDAGRLTVTSTDVEAVAPVLVTAVDVMRTTPSGSEVVSTVADHELVPLAVRVVPPTVTSTRLMLAASLLEAVPVTVIV